MLQPKKMKFPKWHKGKSKGISQRGNQLNFGPFGLKSMETKWVSAQQIEAGRLAIVRTLKRKGKIWTRTFPYKPVTSKGTEASMGGGKGKVSHYVFPVRPGRVIFELAGVEEEKAKEALKRAASKLPVKTRFIKREDK